MIDALGHLPPAVLCLLIVGAVAAVLALVDAIGKRRVYSGELRWDVERQKFMPTGKDWER